MATRTLFKKRDSFCRAFFYARQGANVDAVLQGQLAARPKLLAGKRTHCITAAGIAKAHEVNEKKPHLHFFPHTQWLVNPRAPSWRQHKCISLGAVMFTAELSAKSQARAGLTVLRAVLLLLAVTLAAPGFAQKATREQGQQIARQGTTQGVAACISCHGAQGEGNAAFARLAGTGQAYLQAQLDAFGDGTRKNAVMQPIAQKLTPTERRAVAMYFSQLPAPYAASDAAQPSPSDTGAWLATRGRWADQVPACAQCHGPGGSGVGTQFPPLAGLPATYITEQLQAWKAGTRPPGPLALMPGIAHKLSDAEVTAVAAYYANLAAAAAPGAVEARKTEGRQ